MHDFWGLGFWDDERFRCTGLDAENDAKLVAAKARKQGQHYYAVEIVEAKPSWWDREGGYMVVCTLTAAGIARREEERKKHPSRFSDFEYDEYAWRRRRHEKKKYAGKRPPLHDDRDHLDELEEIISRERVSHRHGWGTLYRQTSKRRDARGDITTWKRHRKTKYRI